MQHKIVKYRELRIRVEPFCKKCEVLISSTDVVLIGGNRDFQRNVIKVSIGEVHLVDAHRVSGILKKVGSSLAAKSRSRRPADSSCGCNRSIGIVILTAAMGRSSLSMATDTHPIPGSESSSSIEYPFSRA